MTAWKPRIRCLRPSSRVLNTFQFGNQVITTKVNLLVPKRAVAEALDVVAALAEPAIGNRVEEDLLLSGMAEP